MFTIFLMNKNIIGYDLDDEISTNNTNIVKTKSLNVHYPILRAIQSEKIFFSEQLVIENLL
jgi:hypothetical protein